MYGDNFNTDELRCTEPAVDGSDFCAEHKDERLCKTSDLTYYAWGTRLACWFKDTMPHHPVDLFFGAPTIRRAFCSDRCRNLWRDTRHRIKRGEEIERVLDGKPSDRYSVIPNFNNTGNTVIYDKKAHRRLS
jgi:hypothetical protein